MRRVTISFLIVIVVMIIAPRGAIAWSDPLWILHSIYDESIISGVSQELYRVNAGLSDPIAPYRVSCTTGTGTVTLDAPGTGTDLSIELDCTGAGTFTTMVAPDFRVYANTGMTGHVTVDYYSLRSGCSQVYMAADDDYTVTEDATVWSVEGHLTVNDWGTMPQAYGDTAPWDVSTGDIVDNDQNLVNGNRPDILIICPPEPTPTSTPSLPATGCESFYSQPMWNGAGYSDRIEFAGSMVGYSVTLTTLDRAPRIIAYQSDRDTPIGDGDWLIYNSPYLISITSPWTFIDETDGFTVSVCWVGEVATYTPTRTPTRTPLPTPMAAGITLTPRPDCRSIAVAFDTYYHYADLVPPFNGGSDYKLYVSDAFAMDSDEYLVAVHHDARGSGLVAVGNMKTANGAFVNIQIDVDGVPYTAEAFIQADALTSNRVMYRGTSSYQGALNALYTPNAQIRVWFKDDWNAAQSVDHYEVCRWTQPTPTPTITANGVQLTLTPATVTPTISSTTVITCDCILIAPIVPPTSIVGSMPDLSLTLPTMRSLYTPTPMLSASPLPFFTPLAAVAEAMQTPMTLLETVSASYNVERAGMRSTEIAGRMSTVMDWAAIGNPAHPAWTTVGGPLWAFYPLLGPVIPLLSITIGIVILAFVFWLMGWFLRIVDLILQLVQSIPFV